MALKRSFYAGAVSMFFLVRKATEYPEREAFLLYDKLEAELKRFQLLLGTPAES